MSILNTKKILMVAGLLTASACSFASHDLMINYLNHLGLQYDSMTVPVMQNGQQVDKNITIGGQTQFVIKDIDAVPSYPLHTPVKLQNSMDDMNCGLYKLEPINPEADSMTIRVEENDAGTPSCYVSTDS